MNETDKKVDATTGVISLKNLYLDPNNFRLINETEYIQVGESDITDKQVIRRTFHLLVGDKKQHIQDLVESFKANGYLPVDQIQVRELPQGGYVVVEGNRRVAALKYLESEFNEKGINLGALEQTIFDRVPTVRYQDADEVHHLTVMALKHISGNKKWAEWNQAMLLEKLHTAHGLPEDNICQRTGISKIELRRSLRALSLAAQYKASEYGDQFDGSKFALFREVAHNSELKNWLEWNDYLYQATNNVNRELFFSWISNELKEETPDNDILQGSEKYYDPALIKRDDIRLLSKIIYDDRALTQLKVTRDINAAYRSSDLVFKERQDSAIKTVAGEINTLAQLAINVENLPELESALGKLQSVVERTKATNAPSIEQKNVFHDRLDCHFGNVDIINYKGLHNIRLSKLSRINIFAGLNNTGKTSLLEAIYLLCRQNDFTGLLEVIRRRGKIPEDRINPEWFVDQLTNVIDISGRFDNSDTQVSIRHYIEENGGIDKSRYLQTVEIASRYKTIQQESLTRLYSGRDREMLADSIRILCPCVFSSPFFLNEPHRYTSFYHKSVQSKALPKIFAFIRDKVVPTISDIRLVDEWQRFLVEDSAFDNPLDITQYGEGLQRVFYISLLFAASQSGVILIDEFENAIHMELISNFAEFVYGLADVFNVQVFLTSHSKECIDAFVKKIPDPSAFSACALVTENNTISVREFSGTEYKQLVDAGNVDLRRAK
jgi:hypothetical protein